MKVTELPYVDGFSDDFSDVVVDAAPLAPAGALRATLAASPATPSRTPIGTASAVLPDIFSFTILFPSSVGYYGMYLLSLTDIPAVPDRHARELDADSAQLELQRVTLSGSEGRVTGRHPDRKQLCLGLYCRAPRKCRAASRQVVGIRGR